MINLKITLLFLSVAVTLVSSAQHQLRKWEVFELKLTAKSRSPNPYAEIPATKEGVLQVTFSGVGGAAANPVFINSPCFGILPYYLYGSLCILQRTNLFIYHRLFIRDPVF